jgi:site-specific DNA-methyltransferase (adenine-specific)
VARKRTATSSFGVTKRESHDASGFYDRFGAPTLELSDDVAPAKPVEEPFQCADARTMSAVGDRSVALVVTSPPYFAGKDYEADLSAEGVPGSYVEYLDLLRDVFAECVRVLEPGGRIAVNVANLGRRPFRSLSADVVTILQDDLGLLLRGEIIWRKGESASGSCAWGSYRSASNPVLRDLTERVIVASKGRFDRAIKPKRRVALGLPHRSTVGADDFIESTLDVWTLPAESATRVGHPAPFPVGLPARLIDLYTYEDDLVLDPFMGSGSTLVAAARARRRFIGFDTDPAYVAIARDRVSKVSDDAPPTRTESASKLALAQLRTAGFTIDAEDVAIRGSGLRVQALATSPDGRRYAVYVGGNNTSWNPGLSSSVAALKAVGELTALRTKLDPDVELMVATTALPPPHSPGGIAFAAATPDPVAHVVELHEPGSGWNLGSAPGSRVATSPAAGGR